MTDRWGWEAVAGLDWARLRHAYGPAADTPGHLRALTGDDPDAQLEAVDHLLCSVVHQYSVHSATAPALRVVGGLLGHPRLRDRMRADGPVVLAVVLEFLDEVAHGARIAADAGAPLTTTLTWADVDVAAERLLEWACAELCTALAELVDVLIPLVDDADPLVGLRAVHVLTAVAHTPGAAPRAAELSDRFVSWLQLPDGRDRRAALVAGVGELGGDTRPWLHDPDEAIRACASVYLPSDPAATEVLQAALTRPRVVDSWFAEPPWLHSPRQRLLEALLERDLTFADLLPVALAIAPVAEKWLPQRDWGLLLQRAFPDVVFEPSRQPPPPGCLDDAQRAFLRALVANDDLWDPQNGTARLARMRVGLPHTQREVLALIGDPPPRRGWWRPRNR